jgi:hypothetical protein
MPGHTFRLIFKSKSGDPTEDDMVASIQMDSGQIILLPLTPALFVPGTLKSTASSQCDNITAQLLESGNLLMFLRRDDRPSGNRLLAVLVDGTTGRPLDVVNDLGAEAGRAHLIKDQSGLRVQVIRKWRETSSLQEPAPVLEWLKLQEANAKLVKRWEMAQP